MRFLKLLSLSLFLTGILLYGFTAIRVLPVECSNVCINAARPQTVIWPCEVTTVGEDGAEGLRIGPSALQGWREREAYVGGDEFEYKLYGYADYKFYISKSGEYNVWVYALWEGACENAIYASFDGGKDAIVGNDPILKEWHWVRGHKVKLAEGTHTLRLSNHSNNIAIQKIILSNDATSRPEELGQVFSDMFYDGFDGCDMGNLDKWEVASGEWIAQDPTQGVCGLDNVLTGLSEGLIYIDEAEWKDYGLHVEIGGLRLANQESWAGVNVGRSGDGFTYQIRLKRGEYGMLSLMLIDYSSEEKLIMAEKQVEWKGDESRILTCIPEGGMIVVSLANEICLEAQVKGVVSGGVGLELYGDASASFDDIHVREAN